MKARVPSRFDVPKPVKRKDVAAAFAEVLRSARTRVGLSQEELAHRAGIDRAYPSLLERRRRTPSLMQLFNLAPPLLLRADRLVGLTANRLDRAVSPVNHSVKSDALARVFANAERLRADCGITTDRLTGLTGPALGIFLQLEQRDRDLKVAQLDVLARALNCDVMDLLMWTS